MVHRLHRPTHAYDGRPTIDHYQSHCTFFCLGCIRDNPCLTWYVNQNLALTSRLNMDFLGFFNVVIYCKFPTNVLGSTPIVYTQVSRGSYLVDHLLQQPGIQELRKHL